MIAPQSSQLEYSAFELFCKTILIHTWSGIISNSLQSSGEASLLPNSSCRPSTLFSLTRANTGESLGMTLYVRGQKDQPDKAFTAEMRQIRLTSHDGPQYSALISSTSCFLLLAITTQTSPFYDRVVTFRVSEGPEKTSGTPSLVED